MISATPQALRERADALARTIGGRIEETRSAIGGGSLPGQTQPSYAVALERESADALAAALRHADPPVIARIEDDRVVLDLRAILPEQDAQLEAAVRSVL
jgi:L-seryl-tRNA(Ser) seleniumtransferase